MVVGSGRCAGCFPRHRADRLCFRGTMGKFRRLWSDHRRAGESSISRSSPFHRARSTSRSIRSSASGRSSSPSSCRKRWSTPLKRRTGFAIPIPRGPCRNAQRSPGRFSPDWISSARSGPCTIRSWAIRFYSGTVRGSKASPYVTSAKAAKPAPEQRMSSSPPCAQGKMPKATSSVCWWLARRSLSISAAPESLPA